MVTTFLMTIRWVDERMTSRIGRWIETRQMLIRAASQCILHFTPATVTVIISTMKQRAGYPGSVVCSG